MKRLFPLLLTLGIFMSGCANRSNALQIEALFDDVGDLVKGAAVQSSDVRIGTVKGIELEGFKASVSMEIDADAELRSDASAFIRSTSLLGEKFVQLTSGVGGRRLADGDVIPSDRTDKVAALDDVLGKLGKILEGGSLSDLGAFIDSAAGIVRDKEQQLGLLFAELRKVTNTTAARAPEIGTAVDNIESTFSALNDRAFSDAIASSAGATQVLADQQADLDRLVDSLADFSEVAGRYASATTEANDGSIKDLRLILDEVMKTTGDLDKSLSTLASFTDLWPRAIPGDYLQLDVTLESGSSNGPQSTSSGASISRFFIGGRAMQLESIIWEPTR